MKKEDIRKEFLKLKNKGHSYSQCRKIIFSLYNYEISSRTLQRWNERFMKTEWDLKDKSKRPKKIYYKITPELENQIIQIKKQTNFGAEKIESLLHIGHTSINKILNKFGLTNPNKNKKKRIKYIRWQRKHPNSLWQMDTSDQKIEDKYCFAVIDDCSRYCLKIFDLNKISTEIITKLLDDIIKIHGKPREILTDNGSVFGSTSKHSQFDRWCRRRNIKHIRTAIHSPTTTGKIERFFGILDKELKFCNKDIERFRMRYNHFRPHYSLNGMNPADIYFAFHRLI
jgi:putative transposase